ncbi:MAG TPA: response regulator, partial [Terriglobales bacterium]|nr:response regulator [Terriglobales bacterium]
MALKILLADDSMTAQNMGKKILVDAGYEVVAVSNGAAAIKKISSERPDIAILDEYMPGYTGSEVCERVKASAETSKIPVLLTVGKMEPFDQQKANKVRADGVMIKPFEASDLIAAIQSIAQRLLTATPAPRTGYDSTAPRTVQSEPDHEDTLRLTPEQIKEVQDASYRDWADTAERGTEEDGESPAEMDVTPAIDAPVSVELAIPVAESEPAAFAAAILEPEAAIPVQETPVFSAITASGVAAEHEIFISPTTPVASVGEPAPVSTDAALYTPPSIENAVEAETPAFIVQPEPVTPAVIEPTLTDEPEIVTPVLEPIVEAIAEPAAEAAPVMAESAPVLLDQAVVVQPDLEPTLAPVVEVSSAPAHGLEVNSPPQEGGAPEIAPDAALVTEAEDMTQFATSFGAQDAEPVHVGLAADLPDTQLAAIVTPAESESSATIEEPAVETPAVGLSVTSAVTEEPL